MRIGLRKFGLFIGAWALAVAGPARATCIDDTVLAAARLHEFETLMMDVSLRCTMMGIDMQAHFQSMVALHQALFDDAAIRLQHYFGAVRDGGSVRHGDIFDRYATLIANKYGGGNTSLNHCHAFDAIVVELARVADGGKELDTVARAMIAHPILEQATCPARP